MGQNLCIEKDCYVSLMETLDAIQSEASQGVSGKNTRTCCLEIGALVVKAKKTMINGTSLGSGDDPSAA